MESSPTVSYARWASVVERSKCGSGVAASYACTRGCMRSGTAT
jgi:hypothetical protein